VVADLTKRNGAFFRYVVNNWQLSSITTLASGHPYGSEQITTKDTPVPGMVSNKTLNGTGFSYRVPWLPVNSYVLPANYRSDARLTKALPFGESGRYKLFLNFEVFNLGEHVVGHGVHQQPGRTPRPRACSRRRQRSCMCPRPTQGSRMARRPGRMQISARFTF